MDQSHISGFPTLPQCVTEMSEEGGKEQEERRNENGKYMFLFWVHTSPVCEKDEIHLDARRWENTQE